jgi:hypothetical protein
MNTSVDDLDVLPVTARLHERSKKTFFGPAMLKHLGELVSALDEMLALYDASEVM